MTLRVYLAAHYARRDEIREYADELKAKGVEVISSWLYERGNIPDDPEGWTKNALGDADDVRVCNCLVMFTAPGLGTAGVGEKRYHAPQGAHSELGMALILRHWIMLVGQKTQIFHYMPGVVAYEKWETVRDILIQDNKDWKRVKGMTPKVLNIKDSQNAVPCGAAYVARPTVWGNPFIIGKHGTRAQVIEKYRKRLLESPELLARLPELKDRDLVCFCAPLPCHADILLEMANK
jgi:hypothetical protein